MTFIHDGKEGFAATALAGFASAHPRHVRHVPNGVVRSTTVPVGKVSLLVGGGSGHFPAFAGYVGPGLADAAVAGDVFASPSTQAIAGVARAANHGGGILMGFGNYAGDVLNFSQAADRLKLEGIEARILPVTDDVASAPPEKASLRRGVAGDLVVFKIAGAAAEAGLDLDGVERVARHTNDRTVSFGVAFSGCTFPGAAAPLFTVPPGRMGVGLGIHGEPGIAEEPILPARDLARLLVEKLAAERPAASDGRVAVILNGLGASKYEELYVLWSSVERELGERGFTLVDPEVGEFVTSLDMAGCSLTLCYLDDELEGYWRAPVDTPVLRKGPVQAQAEAAGHHAGDVAEAAIPESTPESRAGGGCLASLFSDIAATLAEAEEELGRLDSVAGDGDHGHGMRRGAEAAARAARDAADRGAGAATVLAFAADAWADRAGGTSGALWGLALQAWSEALSDTAAISKQAVSEGAAEALAAVVRAGGAKPGDKTLVDAMTPFVASLREAIDRGASLEAAWDEATAAAQAAAGATAQMEPKLGRARPLAARSLGHPDPGAVSLGLVAAAVGAFLRGP
jgi:dihydroxyacetone kinase